MNISTSLIERAFADYQAPIVTPPPIVPDRSSGGAGDVSNITSGGVDVIKTYLNTTFDGIINTITLIAGIAAIIFLIYYGILYITSQGNADKTKIARAGIINAVIGIIIITAAYAIIRLAVTLGNIGNSVV
jgi:hypothetical protein